MDNKLIDTDHVISFMEDQIEKQTNERNKMQLDIDEITKRMETHAIQIIRLRKALDVYNEPINRSMNYPEADKI